MLSSLLACAQLALAADALDGEGVLTQIINNVRQNELLYENREVIGEMAFELLRPVPPGFENMDLADAHEEYRHVGQGGLIYFSFDGYEANMKSRQVTGTVQGYDGVRTTIYEKRAQIGNIKVGIRYEDPRILRPHVLLLFSEFVSVPLSTFLKGDQAILAHPNGIGFEQKRVRPAYAGEEEALGFSCHKISVDLLWGLEEEEPTEVTARRVLWISPERNYLPLRQVCYNLDVSAHTPLEESYVEDLREISAGVWFPYRTVLTGYDRDALALEKRQLPAWRRTWTIEEASLDPSYDISLFRDISIPDGRPVYEEVNGEVVGKYVQGGHAFPAPASADRGLAPSAAPWRLPLTVVSVTLIVGIVVYAVYRYRRGGLLPSSQ